MAAPRIVKKLVGIAPILFGAGVGFFAGLVLAYSLGTSKVDDVVETVIGAALGAGITVFGTLWVTQFLSNRTTEQYEHLVVEAIKGIQGDTSRLVTVLDKQAIPDDAAAEYAAKVRTQTGLLMDGMELFEGLAPFKEIVDYKFRLGLFQLHEELRKCRPSLMKELHGLDDPTISVLRNAQRDLFIVSERIYRATKGALPNPNHGHQADAPKLSAETKAALGITAP